MHRQSMASHETSGDALPPQPDPSLLAELEAHASTLARDAGALLLDYFPRNLKVEYKAKGNRDPVSEADRRADALLIKGITVRFPDHGILSEETLRKDEAGHDFLWVLDPLDGTTNFINRFPCFGVSIAVLYRGMPVSAAMFIPSPVAATGQVLHARLNGGAFIEDTALSIASKEKPSPTGLLSMPAYFWSQYRIGKSLGRRLGEARNTGSITYEMALVASGVLEYAAFGSPKVWDVAAGALIIKEAGGQVLVRRSKPHRWAHLGSFLEPNAGLPKNGNLRRWTAGMLVGNPAAVELVAQNLRPRLRPFRRMRRLVYSLGARATARERRDGAPEQGILDAPEASLPDSERPGPLQGPTGR